MSKSSKKALVLLNMGGPDSLDAISSVRRHGFPSLVQSLQGLRFMSASA